MPAARRLVAQNQDENQILKLDSASRYIVNSGSEWQFLFGPGSALSNSGQVLKIGVEFDTGSFDDVRFVAYLYNPKTGSVDNSASCVFRVFVVQSPSWSEVLLQTLSGVVQPNAYYLASTNLTSLAPASLDGDSTLMVEAVATRLGETYRDRAYFNHLGVFDSVIRLRNKTRFLEITKQDE